MFVAEAVHVRVTCSREQGRQGTILVSHGLTADQTANIVVVLGHDAQKTDVLQGLQREHQYPTLHVHVLPTSSIPTSDSKTTMMALMHCTSVPVYLPDVSESFPCPLSCGERNCLRAVLLKED
jgi:hypothetical protein